MKCSVLIAASFIFCATAYGASSAANAEALKDFTPILIIVFRMLFGFGFNLMIMGGRYAMTPAYRPLLRAHFNSGPWPIIHLVFGGLLNLGIPHSLITIAQQWVPSAAVQLCKPLTPAASALFGLLPCVVTSEKFTRNKFYALCCSVVGVSLTATPSFLHTSGGNISMFDMVIGYVLLICAMALFGIAAVYFNWKTPNTDITVSSLIQTLSSCIFTFFWGLIMDGPTKTFDTIKHARPIGWVWPLLLGVLASGVAVHGFMYLVSELGAVGANFIPFGQIIVGVTLGVAWLGEWNAYRWWEIMLNVFGILFLVGAILLGFLKDKSEKPDEPKKEEEEEANEEEDKHVHLTEL